MWVGTFQKSSWLFAHGLDFFFLFENASSMRSDLPRDRDQISHANDLYVLNRNNLVKIYGSKLISFFVLDYFAPLCLIIDWIVLVVHIYICLMHIRERKERLSNP